MNRLCTLLLLLLCQPLLADERILSFHSDILVRSDATIEVTETIRVRAEGRQIRRGIYRDIPVEYTDAFGNRLEVSVTPLAVQRNGRSEDYHVKRLRDTIRVYFGRSDHYLEAGIHEYRYRYRATRMLGFFDDRDELYWNVSGFDWRFPIDKAGASVRFEFDVDPDDLQLAGYTGPFGSKGQDFTVSVERGPVVNFTANAPLSPANGLTIAVGWPKGLVEEPAGLQRLAWLLADNRNVLLASCGIILLLAYFIPVWLRFGRDPDEGVVVTRYEPPENYSPASLRYVHQMSYDNKVMTSAIVNLAVKGYLSIHDDGDTRLLVRETPGAEAAALATGERELYEALFRDGGSVELKQENHARLAAARLAHRRSLQADYKGRYFRINALLNLPGAFLAVVFTVLTFRSGLEPTPLSMLLVVAMYAVLVVFAIIMKRPTMRGRRLLDEVIGFQDYLEVAEKDEMNLRNPPEKTPELFERFLPYALALGVDQAWSERFAGTLAAIRDDSGQGYQPGWYHGGRWQSSTSLASSLSGGFNSALAQSVSPPGSSSGSGGGGFSGGGGGGGGGGGW